LSDKQFFSLYAKDISSILFIFISLEGPSLSLGLFSFQESLFIL